MSESLHYVALLNEVSEIEILKVGKVRDRNIEITSEMLDDIIENFDNGAYGSKLQVNLSHDRGGEAAGWIQSLFREGDTLKAKVEWTPLGVEKVASKQFQYTSSEIEFEMSHAKTGKKVKNILIGVALTNIPAVKGMREVTLSEEVQNIIHLSNTMDKLKEMYDALVKKGKGKVTPAEMAAFKEACSALGDNKDAKEMLSKVSKLSEGEGDDKGGEAGAGEGDDKGTGEEAKTEDEKKADEALTEELKVMKAKGFVVLSEKQLKDLTAQANKGAEAAAEMELLKLSEQVKTDLCLSTERGTGLRKEAATVEKTAKFMQGLSKEQRAVFKEIMGAVVSVDLSERGSTEASSEVSGASGLAEKLQEASVEAQKRATETNRPLHECLGEVYKEMKLDQE